MMAHYLQVSDTLRVAHIDPISGIPRNIESSEASRRDFPEFFSENEAIQTPEKKERYKSEESSNIEIKLKPEEDIV